MERKGTDQWLQELAEEEPDAAYLAVTAVRPDDAVVPEWADTHWQAWHALRFDRQYGAFGGETPIAFESLDAYARRYELTGVEFEIFLTLVGEMDDEYLQHVTRVAKDAKDAEDRRKNQ